jgi:putative spermidine/putrescine transport system substrate-binding protein
MEEEGLVTITGSNNESLTRLNEGEVSLAVAWDDDTFIAFKKGMMMKQAKLYIPELGLPGGGDTAGVLKNAKNKAAALLFLAYLIEPEMQVQMNDTIGSYLARTDVTGKEAILSEEERQKYGMAWVPAPYKNHFIQEFVKQVLMK